MKSIWNKIQTFQNMFLFSDNEDGEPFEEDENKEDPVTKIFFCSRTHSQISQFIGELQKTVYAEHTRVVTLGSRMVFQARNKPFKNSY